ncbi:MAG: molecular chaperone DnaJ [Spirochaetaceae bacterium]|nr:MAG: molecular chaperone DnaJ [Spirochaetaceae bacterium]
MAKRDYYEVLGLQKGASKDEIKKAYRRVAVANHPDRNPGDTAAEERFKEATEAYEVLADEQKRQAYDQFGFAGVEGMGGAGGGFQDFSSVFRDFEDIFGDFSGIFDSFFGGSGRGRRGRGAANRGADLRYELEISFTEAVFGTRTEISYRRHATCDACNGSGAESGSGRKTCQTCGGAGQVRRSSGFFSIASACPACNGEGFVIENPCRKCRGSGLLQKQQRVKVTIPAGMDNGKRISIAGQGDVGPAGGPAGDLYVVVHVRPHEYFERHANDVYCIIPISITQAALGAEITVPTLDDKRMKVKIPSGTQNDRVLRLKNEGVPFLQDPARRGDMYIKVRVSIPGKLSGKARSLLRELAQVEGENGSPEPVKLADIK